MPFPMHRFVPLMGGGAKAVFTLSGTVFDSDGVTGVDGVTISITYNSITYQTTTAGGGLFTLSGLPAGLNGSLSASKANTVIAPLTISIAALAGNLTGKVFYAVAPINWFDFSTTTGLYQANNTSTPVTADGQTIGYAVDKSGIANQQAVQATAGNRPVWKANIQNGLGVARFPGGTGPALVSTWAATHAQPNMIFMVGITTAAEGVQQAFFDGLLSTKRQEILTQTTASPDAYYVYAGADLTPGVAIPKNAWKIWTTLFNGASSQLWENGVSKFTGNAGTNDATGLTIANAYDASKAWVGDQGEIIEINANCAAVVRAAIETMLNTKWAVF